jgi:hypothetical protein
LARPVGLASQLLELGDDEQLVEQVVDAEVLEADISTTIVSPPHASGTSSCSASWLSTRCGSAFSLSILLTATTIGTSAAGRG